MLEFSDSNDQLFCPFPSTHKRSSSSPSSSLGIFFAHDKKQYEKQATRTRIGQAFRNSWARKDSEHKASKKCNLLVTTLFIWLISVFIRYMQMFKCTFLFFVFGAGYGYKICYWKLCFLSNIV
jgi:hypothetical protein